MVMYVSAHLSIGNSKPNPEIGRMTLRPFAFAPFHDM